MKSMRMYVMLLMVAIVAMQSAFLCAGADSLACSSRLRNGHMDYCLVSDFRKCFFEAGKSCPALIDHTSPLHDAEINKRLWCDKLTLLHLAARETTAEPMRLLLEYGAAPSCSIKSLLGYTPLDEVLIHDDQSRVEKARLLSRYHAPFSLNIATSHRVDAVLLSQVIQSYPKSATEVSSGWLEDMVKQHGAHADLWRTLFENGVHFSLILNKTLVHPEGDLLRDVYVDVSSRMKREDHSYIDGDLKLIADKETHFNDLKKRREEREMQEKAARAAADAAAYQAQQEKIKQDLELQWARWRYQMSIALKDMIGRRDDLLFEQALKAYPRETMRMLVRLKPPLVDLGAGVEDLRAYAQLSHLMPPIIMPKKPRFSCSSRADRERVAADRERAARDRWEEKGRVIRGLIDQLETTDGIQDCGDSKQAPGGPMELREE